MAAQPFLPWPSTFTTDFTTTVFTMTPLRQVLFVPHGSPMMALNPGAAGAALSALGVQLGTPRAIVVISPHWDTALPTVGSATQPETLHDFGGFDPRLYDLLYPAPGSPEVAGQVVAALQAAGLPAAQDARRGLDHGAWMPLRQMFPLADVPVVPLSMQSHGGPEHAYRVGQALTGLAQQGILVLASGNITHNLRDFMAMQACSSPSPTGSVPHAPAYVQAFADWVHTQMTAHDVPALLAYRQQASGERAHPSEEHLLPLFTALGAAGPQAQAQAFFRGISDHVIAMDGYAFH
jgi:4,5-DOPA dioxygenase extradiol